jgi:hypothetical protein
VFRARVANPRWIASMIRHGYKGAAELSATVDYLFGYDATTGVAEDWMYEQVADRYLLDDDVAEFMSRSNPWAARAIAERLLEAADRGMWEEPRRTCWPASATASSTWRVSSRGRARDLPAHRDRRLEALSRRCSSTRWRRRSAGARARRARHGEVDGRARAGAAAAAGRVRRWPSRSRSRRASGRRRRRAGRCRVAERPAPLVELPLGATLDRLVGALDLGRALAGDHALRAGLLARAHRGILYVDEVNLLPDHLVDALLDAAASGSRASSATRCRSSTTRGSCSWDDERRGGRAAPAAARPLRAGRRGARARATRASRAEIVRRRLAFERIRGRSRARRRTPSGARGRDRGRARAARRRAAARGAS